MDNEAFNYTIWRQLSRLVVLDAFEADDDSDSHNVDAFIEVLDVAAADLLKFQKKTNTTCYIRNFKQNIKGKKIIVTSFEIKICHCKKDNYNHSLE